MTARWRLQWLAEMSVGTLMRDDEREKMAGVTRLRAYAGKRGR